MKVFVLKILVLLSIEAHSQVVITNRSLLVDTNLLYQNTENWLRISGTKEKVSLFSTNNNSISTYNNVDFNVRPKNLLTDTLLVYAGKKLLLKRPFAIDTLRALRFQLGNIQKDTASIAEILANRGIRFFMKGCLYYSPIWIISFVTTFVGPQGETLPEIIPVEGNLLSNEQIVVIKKLSKGSKIVFERVIVISASGKAREIGPFAIVIK